MLHQQALACRLRGFALQTYLYIRFPSETITRSGYQIKRKHDAVAAAIKGTVYCCGARYAFAVHSLGSSTCSDKKHALSLPVPGSLHGMGETDQ